MKRFKKLSFIIFSFGLLLFICGCEREWSNPFDDKSAIDPESWAPQNFLIEDVTITEKKLTWSFTETTNFEGFKIDRKIDDEPWQVAYQVFGKEVRSWNDAIIPDTARNYSYRLYAYAGNNRSGEISLTESAAIPQPTNLQLEKLTDITYKLTWQDNSTGEEGFKIDRKVADTEWVIGYGTVGANETSFVDTNVFVGKSTFNVEYRVYAIYMEYESAKTTESTSATLTPPTDLIITKNTITTVTLNWQKNSTGEQGFKIERKYATGDWILVATTTGISWQDNDFELSSMVYYRVYAYVGNYASAFSENSFDAIIPPPTNLQITNNSITSVSLNWQDNSTGEQGFKIERKYETGDWVEVATTTGTTWQDNDFELNTMVYYRVNAYYNQYSSAWLENLFDASIPPPENLSITANSATSVTLNWSYSLTGHEGFKIERKIDNGSWEILINNLGPGQMSFTDDGLDVPQHEYNYRVFAFLNEFQSNYAEGMAQYIPAIGEIYKGGIVFYLDGNGGGLVCAETDQSTNAEWGCYGTTIGGTGTGIGTGAANTAAIVAGCSASGIAARICNDLVLNSYSDWFLPSKDELNLMYQNLKTAGIGGFADDYYWSSSEYSSNYAWIQYFYNGYQYYFNKFSYNRVRAVRAF